MPPRAGRTPAAAAAATCATCASSCPPPSPAASSTTGAARSASSTCVEPLLDFYYRLLVPGGGRGRRERAGRRRRADRVEPLRRAAAGRADDHAGDPPRAPEPAAAVHARRGLVQGLPGRRHARQQARAGGRPPGERAAPARTTRAGSCSCSPRARRAARKLFWQRYRLRRFGRGGFVRTAMRAGVPIVPIAVIGAEEAMPIFAHVPLLQRLTGLIYFPINHAFPHFGLAAGLMYMPAKFKIRFLEPIDLSAYDPEDADDMALVGRLIGADPTADPGGAGRPGTGAQVRLVRVGCPVVGTRVRACIGLALAAVVILRAAAARTSRTRPRAPVAARAHRRDPERQGHRLAAPSSAPARSRSRSPTRPTKRAHGHARGRVDRGARRARSRRAPPPRSSGRSSRAATR